MSLSTSRRSLRRGAIGALALLAASLPGGVQAAENGLGTYLLGQRALGAGMFPHEGVYFQSDTYIYNGGLGGGRTLPFGGQVSASVRSTAILEAMSMLWVTPWQIFGGRVALGGTLPVGYARVDANVVVGPLLGSRSDTIFTVADPVLMASIGWSHGQFHWSANASVNVPVGDYQRGQLANIAFHRWSGDFTLAGTWIDPQLGLDVSGAVGITFNGTNPVTDYRTGTELHLEWAVGKSITKEWKVGFIGYHYQQISDDSGSGAVLGGYRGRVTAVGGMISHMFHVSHTPMQLSLKLLREFDTKNRAQGTVGFISLAVPLSIHGTNLGLLQHTRR